MSRSVISKGKHVQEAIELALQLLNTGRDSIDIEIIAVETKGILGIRSKPAVVKVTTKDVEAVGSATPANPAAMAKVTGSDKATDPYNVTDSFDQLVRAIEQLDLPHDTALSPIEPQVEPSKTVGNVEGKVWVKDGQIHCKDSGNHYSTVTPCKGCVLYKNGVIADGTVIIREQDSLRVELQQDSVPTKWDIYLDSKQIKAILHLRPGYVIERKLRDQEPEEHIELQIEERRIQHDKINIQMILNRLAEKGVVQGLNHFEIVRACESEEGGEFVIAAGREPEPGINGFLEYMVDVTGEASDARERYDGSIDYREMKRIPTVKKGELIAKVRPPIEGRPGLTVTGVSILPPPVHPMAVIAGKGAVLMEDGKQVVATNAGRPQIQIRGQFAKISILEKLYHDTDVDMKTGNIRFTGDVEILGNVEEGMEVFAEGNIFLHKNVNMSKITSGDSIEINGNVIGSEIVAGKSNLLIAEMSQLLSEMALQVKHIILAVEQLYRTSAFTTADIQKIGVSTLIKILLESKFKTLPALVKQFYEKTREGKLALGEEWLDFANRLYLGFCTIHPNALRGIEDLENIKHTLNDLHQLSITPPDPNSSIIIPYALNSQIYCSGEIIVTGQGCYNTKIHAGGVLKVKGFLRGGNIYAGWGAEITEAGSKGGVPTFIAVPHDRSILIKVAMEETVIQVGKKQHKFLQETRNIYARLNKDNQLVLF